MAILFFYFEYFLDLFGGPLLVWLSSPLQTSLFLFLVVWTTRKNKNVDVYDI